MFDLAINTTLDQKPKVAAQPSPLDLRRLLLAREQGCAIFRLFGKEFPSSCSLVYSGGLSRDLDEIFVEIQDPTSKEYLLLIKELNVPTLRPRVNPYGPKITPWVAPMPIGPRVSPYGYSSGELYMEYGWRITRLEYEIGEATIELNYIFFYFEDDALMKYLVDNLDDAREAIKEIYHLEAKFQRLTERKEALKAEHKALTDTVRE
ncbi:hypothetical protein V6N13_018842 [Hibiscus sabdariffa]